MELFDDALFEELEEPTLIVDPEPLAAAPAQQTYTERRRDEDRRQRREAFENRIVDDGERRRRIQSLLNFITEKRGIMGRRRRGDPPLVYIINIGNTYYFLHRGNVQNIYNQVLAMLDSDEETEFNDAIGSDDQNTQQLVNELIARTGSTIRYAQFLGDIRLEELQQLGQQRRRGRGRPRTRPSRRVEQVETTDLDNLGIFEQQQLLDEEGNIRPRVRRTNFTDVETFGVFQPPPPRPPAAQPAPRPQENPLVAYRDRTYGSTTRSRTRSQGPIQPPPPAPAQRQMIATRSRTLRSRQGPRTRSRTAAEFNNLGFFPYTHNIDDEDLSSLLARLGLFKKVEKENYEDNCLVKAIEESGVLEKSVVNDIKCKITNKVVARKHLTKIGRLFGLCFVVHSMREDKSYGNRRICKFGDPKGKVIELGIMMGHYFLFINNTGYCGFAVKNYKELKEKYPARWMNKFNMNGGSKRNTITSMTLLKILTEETDFTREIDLSDDSIYETIYADKVKTTFRNKGLDYPENAVKLVHPKRMEEIDRRDYRGEYVKINILQRKLLEKEGGEEAFERISSQIERLGLGPHEHMRMLRANQLPDATIFFDFETCTTRKHIPYLCCWQVDGESRIFNAKGETCAIEFLEWIAREYDRPDEDVQICLIAHNVSYDIQFLLEYVENGSLSALKRGSKYVTAEAKFGHIELIFKDSWRMIPSKLSDFPKMFNLEDHGKEILPYSLFDPDFIKGDFMVYKDEMKIMFPDMYEDMLANVTKWNCTGEDGKWDMMKYSLKYCEMDVQILSKGWNAYRKQGIEIFEIDINGREILTAAGMAYNHLLNTGCFVDAYSVSGVPLEFFRQGTTGGQTQVRNNESCLQVEGHILDMDKVSLYPYAISEFPGIPKGKPKVWSGNWIPENCDYFYCEIEVLKYASPNYDFPIVAIRDDKTGLNDWSNELEGKALIVGKRTLLDLIEWTDTFEYRVIHGYYWDEGFNDTFCKVIKRLFDLRLEFKRQKNPAQLVVKLLMNSSYGRCGLKPISTEDKYLEEEKLNSFLVNNYERINDMTVMPNGDMKCSVKKSIDEHFNTQYCAAMILEYAKHFMRKILLMSQRLMPYSLFPNQIYYTDTDSVHISLDAWNELKYIFDAKYGEKIEGKKLGQFHSDFELAGTYQNIDGHLKETIFRDEDLGEGGELYSKKFYCCGKKAYLDVLTSTQNQNLEVYHFRLKGVPHKTIISKVDTCYGGCIETLYQDLCKGEAITFTIDCMFKCSKDSTMSTIQQNRVIQFTPTNP